MAHGRPTRLRPLTFEPCPKLEGTDTSKQSQRFVEQPVLRALCESVLLSCSESMLLSCSNSLSWPSRSRCRVSVVTHSHSGARGRGRYVDSDGQSSICPDEGSPALKRTGCVWPEQCGAHWSKFWFKVPNAGPACVHAAKLQLGGLWATTLEVWGAL